MLTVIQRYAFQGSISESIYLFLRLSIGIIFIWAGFLKLMDPKSFGQIISQYRILDDTFIPFIAIGLPLLEVLAGAGLIFERRYSLGLITIMVVFFLFILWFGILNNLEIDCGCFSLSEQNYHDGIRSAFKRDWILLFCAFFLFYHRFRTKKAFIF